MENVFFGMYTKKFPTFDPLKKFLANITTRKNGDTEASACTISKFSRNRCVFSN